MENACVFVCFMSAAYQSSANCRLECKFAAQNGLPFVCVMVDPDPAWRASGWLGIVTAGCLWLNLDDEGSPSSFDASIDRVVSQIKQLVATVSQDDDEEAMAADTQQSDSSARVEDLKEELTRLRQDLDTSQSRDKSVKASAPGALADIPSLVPTLPRDFRETSAIQQLRDMLLGGGLAGAAKVGFFGMGVSAAFPSFVRSILTDLPMARLFLSSN